MSNVSKRRKDGSKSRIKSMGDHKEFLRRITKTLYYGQLPSLPCLSLPVTEVSCEVWSVSQRGRSLRRLHADAAAGLARSACVSPCALVLALLYLERLNSCNPDYLAAAAPAELFLVSLMVGNKFLQDDGEDDDVICSEWATSGGVELKQLKKLEVEFLTAIDWNVFVNDKSFEAGLQWLERQVALRQARLRGFFTYSDLAASCDAAPLGELVKCVTALALGYLATLATLATVLTSTLVISHACLPAAHHIAAAFRASTRPATASDTNILTNDFQPELPHLNNATIDRLIVDVLLARDSTETDKIKCCTNWLRYRDERSRTETNRNRFDAVVTYDWKSFEPWWSKTSVLNWLYRSSLVDPMQRWLERVNEYVDLFGRRLIHKVPEKRVEQCQEYGDLGAPQCVRQWLNFSKLSAFMATVSDR